MAEAGKGIGTRTKGTRIMTKDGLGCPSAMHASQRTAGYCAIIAVVICPLLTALPGLPGSAAAGCPWGAVIGERLLDARVGSFSCTDVTVESVWLQLASDHAVPLSFIQAEPEAKISLDLRDATVRQVLDAVVARAPAYRYGVIHDRLVLFPRDQKWDMRLDGFKLGPADRFSVAVHLADELSRRVPAFAGLLPPTYLVMGRVGSIYRDVVTVASPGTVLELLVQLLGPRPSAVFSLTRDRRGHQVLELSGLELLPSFVVTAPTTTLRDRADTVQLKVLGKLRGVGESLDFTAGSCGTTYSSSDEEVVAVSADGLVSVRGSGTATVGAWNDTSLSSLLFTVILPATPKGPPPTPARGRGEGAGPVTKPLRSIEITVQGASATAAVQLLRRQACAPVSFIAAARGGTVSLSVRGATVAEVLRQIAAQDPTYRAETIAGREVLYPAAPEFQVALAGIDIASTPRLEASYRYLERLRRDVPAFSTLAPPMVIGDSRHPIFSQKVTLRPTGRVIEHLVDLLGQNPDLYFEFGKAMSGVPELDFDMVNCAGAH